MRTGRSLIVAATETIREHIKEYQLKRELQVGDLVNWICIGLPARMGLILRPARTMTCFIVLIAGDRVLIPQTRLELINEGG
jgi:hypothetical protein